MPTISRSDMSFGGVRYMRTVNFSNKSRMFSVAIPKECHGVLGYERIEDATLDGLEKKFREGSAQFLNAKAKTRKVIVYKVLMNCAFDEQENMKRFETTGFHDEGVGVQVMVGVYIEKRFRMLGKDENLVFEPVKSSLPEFMSPDQIYKWDIEKYTILDWTEEREKFFRTFGEAMSKLCRMVSRFLGDEKKLLELIARGARILPPPEPEKSRRKGQKC